MVHTEAIVNKFSNAKIYLNNFIIPRSSSGRTKDSGSFNDGSNPSLGVFYQNQSFCDIAERLFICPVGRRCHADT